jgi:hypothetical protein
LLIKIYFENQVKINHIRPIKIPVLNSILNDFDHQKEGVKFESICPVVVVKGRVPDK